MPSKKSNSKSQEGPKPLHICIVGGGSSGWMMAAYVTNHFKFDGRKLKMTLIESAEVPPTGVGEATIHTMRGYLEDAGISEEKFLNECQGTFKHGIEFVGWSENTPPFFHPFENPPVVFENHAALNFLKADRSEGAMARYDYWAGIQSRLARRGVSPRQKSDVPYHGIVPYGYHLDANAFAHFLKKIATQRGVNHIISHVDKVESTKGKIDRLHLRNGKQIEADIFVDCTGFAARLIKELGGEFISGAEQLLVDSAVTCQVDAKDIEARPFTTATARNAGWTFDIDLQTRGGRGYVYSSKYLSKDEAFKEFSDAYPGQLDESRARHFQLRIGRMDKAWKGNCCAIGLAAGFLEPMESTGLYFVEYTARLFVEVLKSLTDNNMEVHADWFSNIFSELFDEVSAFIEAHYKLSDRRDTQFWRDATSAPHSPRLAQLLSLWESRAPGQFDFTGRSFFGAESWQAILFGLGWRPQKSHRLATVDQKAALAHFKVLKGHADRIAATNPQQADYLGL
ncbi:Flavin-dependent tryptophan halogenase PrnA [Shimia sp. SK013]|uniref:tryptophan halogenase family protein n=1 Tax=Shimia sp. SK013 TaxID=1389006 RepID=UPI0006CDE79C|nr:tryptophan halogenase family protein [Shimia sp. SK013]KPA23681.1 Flavin-dependent tryptophan halogenase PrnA [Shimia sp. SK013]